VQKQRKRGKLLLEFAGHGAVHAELFQKAERGASARAEAGGAGAAEPKQGADEHHPGDDAAHWQQQRGQHHEQHAVQLERVFE